MPVLSPHYSYSQYRAPLLRPPHILPVAVPIPSTIDRSSNHSRSLFFAFIFRIAVALGYMLPDQIEWVKMQCFLSLAAGLMF